MPALPKKLATSGSAAALLAAAFLAAYVPDAGRGFIKDDFRWVRETRLESVADAPRLFTRTDGFYRPLVSLTFAANSAAAGIAPRAFGLTNVALALIDAVLVFFLARRLGLDGAAALLAAAVWAFNFHGINMSVLWISGRTALVVTLGALAAAIAFVSGRTLLAGCCCLAAMLAKEEAVVLPLTFAAWATYETHAAWAARLTAAAQRTWPCFVALLVYLALRLQTDAFWPASAPSYYRLSFSPGMLAQNILQYADRAITWAAVVALIVAGAAAFRARLGSGDRRIVAFGAIWLTSTFALTIFVPVRSSLYAVLPSVGAALAAGAIAAAAARHEPRRVMNAMAALAVLPILLLPIYWSRNERWSRLADVSSAVLNDAQRLAQAEHGRRIVLVDDPTERFNLESAFGSLWPDAAALCLPREMNVEIGTDAGPDALVLRLDGGRLTRVR